MVSILEPAPAEKSAICDAILRALPDWFAIEQAIRRYAEEAAALPMLVARAGDEPVGFVTLQRQSAEAWEIHVIGVRTEWHRRGIGRLLLGHAASRAREHGALFLAVKTLSASHPDPAYAQTRRFYDAMGFRPLMELPTLWSAENPCLVMVKVLAPGDTQRRLTAGRLVVATHNPGKVVEIAELLQPYGIEPVAAGALGLPEPEETGATFRANAEIKARAAAIASGEPALADDSGLDVAALGGAPGIRSARWAGPDKDFRVAMKRVEEELAAKGDPDRRARFVCALALCWPDGECAIFEGTVAGQLAFPPRGGRGFGYDPIFVPDGYDLTFGEMEPAAKHAMSHRAVAFRKFVDACLAP
jgi:XTP/dITP diphosphohydrolase